ncbi:MAG TPA: acetate kinase [Myxococcales bacterium]|nr:acetate kinase [Myxococcales bacterium]
MPDLLLTVNAGSSSLRLAAFRAEGGRVEALARVRHDARPEAGPALLREFLERQGLGPPATVAHRVVHGGREPAPRRIDDSVEALIDRFAEVAPLHNPPALAWIRACRSLFGPTVPQVAVFDTSFFTALPEAAAAYALPRALREAHGLRRYGFHGLAHRSMWRRLCELRPDRPRGGRLVTLQLGSGCSAAAIDHGQAVDCSMGFTPLEGLVMATRAGDVDPGLLLYLERVAGLDAAALEHVLNAESGLRGLSGTSGDMRELLALVEAGHHPDAALAVDVFCHRARKYVGSYLAVLGGADALVFGGGIGEHLPQVRERVLRGMEGCGLALSPQANAQAVGAEARLDVGKGGTEIWVVQVDEERILAEDALALLA